MNVLVIGNGGREHALAWKASLSPLAETVYVAPGNAGTAIEPGLTNVDIAVDDIEGLCRFAREQSIGLTIVGPEVPLVKGVVDAFQAEGLKIFGPSRAAAQLEGSKAFTKDFLHKYAIPTADYGVFTNIDEAIDYINSKGAPIVVKADGLAAGKGVIVAETENQAIDAVKDMLSANKFGDAGHRVVIEEFLVGEEASFIVMADGENVLTFATSQDHKARDDGDKGPNTGGMGAYSPAPVVTKEISAKIMEQVIYPTIKGMASEGIPYTGFLYAGLMISPAGDLKVLEYNCRFGDPETQPIMMRLESDLVALCLAATEKKLNTLETVWKPGAALGVVMAAGGYPFDYNKGDTITGLGTITDPLTKVFHAGTATQGNNVVTSGGRVLCVTALGENVTKAQQAAYRAVKKIQWKDAYFRTDIGHRAVARENA